MSKMLHGLREWLSVPDAATYLTRELSEPVREVDVIRLGLDSLLQLSVHFVNQAMANVGGLPAGEFLVDDLGQLAIAWSHDMPQVISGVWDLVLAGSGEIELEGLFQRLTGGPEVTLWSVGGLYLAKPDRSEWAELVSLDLRDVSVHTEVTVGSPRGIRGPRVKIAKSYRSMRALPEDAVLVVRTGALDSFTTGLLSNDTRFATSAIADGTGKSRPIPLQKAQELAILSKLRDLGIDPLAMKPSPAGKPSLPKRGVREALGYSPEVMRKAWRRLRVTGQIKDS